jgi:hypothetical protein
MIDTLAHATSEIVTFCFYSKSVVIPCRFLTNIFKQIFLFWLTVEIIPGYKFKRNIISETENFASEVSQVNKGSRVCGKICWCYEYW